MVANKKTRKNVTKLCDDIINLLTDLKIDNKSTQKKVDKIINEANNCKEIIDGKETKKHNITGYNNFVKDCYNIKKGEKTSGILNLSNEKNIKNNIENNKDKHIFTIFGDVWKTLDETVKNKYNVDKIDKEKKLSKRGRPHKIKD